VPTPYRPGYEQVTSSTYVPVVILGGAKTGSERDMLTDIKASIDAGGAGVAIGRNVFQSSDPAAMTAAIVSIVHGGATVDEAMALMPSGN